MEAAAMIKGITIRALKEGEYPPYKLLLTADPSKKMIKEYISNSPVYIAILNGATIGCYVLSKIGRKVVEIKNIAVIQKYQGRGIGTFLLKDANKRLKQMGAKKTVIATGNSSIGQIALYQKQGFRISQIIPDYFRRHYRKHIIENGIECRDKIVLIKKT